MWTFRNQKEKKKMFYVIFKYSNLTVILTVNFNFLIEQIRKGKSSNIDPIKPSIRQPCENFMLQIMKIKQSIHFGNNRSWTSPKMMYFKSRESGFESHHKIMFHLLKLWIQFINFHVNYMLVSYVATSWFSCCLFGIFCINFFLRKKKEKKRNWHLNGWWRIMIENFSIRFSYGK